MLICLIVRTSAVSYTHLDVYKRQAEYFAVEHNQKVLVLLTDMTSYADALAIVSNRMDQIPS